MSEAVLYRLGNDSPVLFELDEDVSTVGRVSRGTDGVVEATHRLEESLESVREAARATLRVLQALSPQKLELEFGVKMTAEAGALIAKTSGEAHFVVKVVWEPEGSAGSE